eukprot:3496335-Rhodomonas_salina.1
MKLASRAMCLRACYAMPGVSGYGLAMQCPVLTQRIWPRAWYAERGVDIGGEQVVNMVMSSMLASLSEGMALAKASDITVDLRPWICLSQK